MKHFTDKQKAITKLLKKPNREGNEEFGTERLQHLKTCSSKEKENRMPICKSFKQFSTLDKRNNYS